MGNNKTVTRKGSRKSPLLNTTAIAVARSALEELGEGDIGEHIGVGNIGMNSATHRFKAHLPGYAGWEWNVVVACAKGSQWITVSEVALVPGAKALKVPDWVPYHDRVQPGDLGPGDLMPPYKGDARLTTNPDYAVVAQQQNHGGYFLSEAGFDQAAKRWRSVHGPRSSFAKKSALPCVSCAFYIPLAGAAGERFGVCANEYSADGLTVAADYGCGAHSETPPADRLGNRQAPAFDDELTIEVEF